MQDILAGINRANSVQLPQLLQAVLERYAELYPDWEVNTISLQRSADRSEQLDRIIAMLEQMKTFP